MDMLGTIKKGLLNYQKNIRVLIRKKLTKWSQQIGEILIRQENKNLKRRHKKLMKIKSSMNLIRVLELITTTKS